jgi:hypothetical protein
MANGFKRCYLCGVAGIKEDFTKLFSDDGHYHWVCKSCAEEQEAEDQAERELALVPASKVSAVREREALSAVGIPLHTIAGSSAACILPCSDGEARSADWQGNRTASSPV